MRPLYYYLALLVEAAAFHRHVLFYPGHLFPWDFRVVHLPLFSAIVRAFSNRELPLWDPFTYGGVPIYANIQTALFYPPTIVAAWIGTLLDPDSLPRLLGIAMVLHIVFAGVCTFALLRKLGARSPSAFLGATMFQLGCFFASQAQHMGAIEGASWLPFSWFCVLKLRESFQWRWMAVLSVALAMPILAGLPQIAVTVAASAVCLALILMPRLALTVAASAAWAVLIAAVQYIPTYELTMNSVAKYRTEWLQGGGGIHTEALWSLVVPNYWGVFDPGTFKGPGDLTFLYLYSGIIGLGLVIAGVLYKPDRRAVTFAIMTIGSGLWMMGEWTPVGATILSLIPKSIRIGIHPEFSLCVFSLAAAILAGLAADRLLPNARVQLVVAALIGLELIGVSSGRAMNMMDTAREPGITHDAIDGSKELVTRLRQLTASGAWFDISPDVHFNLLMTPPLLQLPTAGGCDPLAPERMIEVRRTFAAGPHWGTCFRVEDPASPTLGLIDSRYLLSHAPVNSPFHTQIDEVNGYRIYERRDTRPRYYFANGEGTVTGQLSGGLTVDSTVGGLLVITEAYYPGWEATIDGKPAPISLTNAAFRGMQVPAGKHRIEMKFRPKILLYSAGVSVVGLLLVVIAWTRKSPNSPREANGGMDVQQ